MSDDPNKTDSSPRPELFDFHGITMTHYVTDNWENVQNFQARPDDILIVTYPKAGTTWVSYILDLLYFGQTSIQIHQRVPFLEFTFTLGSEVHIGVDLAEKLSTSPRLIKTHVPVQFVPKSFWEQNCKIIYLARNAKDNMVSYFHFDRMNIFQPDSGNWNSYFHRFIDGKMVYGSWYDHVNGWWKKKQTYPNLHFMFYEDLIQDTGREIDKLCSFVCLSPSVEEKKKITDSVHFDNMKSNEMVNYSKVPMMKFEISPFLRKGRVGDWKNHFTVAQNEKFDEDYKKKMKDPRLQLRTEI